jgi:hypothetical protein
MDGAAGACACVRACARGRTDRMGRQWTGAMGRTIVGNGNRSGRRKGPRTADCEEETDRPRRSVTACRHPPAPLPIETAAPPDRRSSNPAAERI